MSDITDKQLIERALNYWANYIETNFIELSAIDAQQRGKRVNAMGLDQYELVVRLRHLAEKQRSK